MTSNDLMIFNNEFQLFIAPPVERINLEMTDLEGSCEVQEKWKPLDQTDLHAFIGILVLAGAYRSKGEATGSLWNEENGRTVNLSSNNVSGDTSQDISCDAI